MRQICGARLVDVDVVPSAPVAEYRKYKHQKDGTNSMGSFTIIHTDFEAWQRFITTYYDQQWIYMNY